MTNPITSAKNLWRKQKSKFSVVRRTRSAVLGNGQGNSASNVEVPNSPDHVWVRDTAEAVIFYPILDKTGLPHTPDMPVLIGYTDEEPNVEQVLGIFAEGLGETSISTVPTTLAHKQQHEFGGWDVPDVEGRLLTPGRVSPTSPASMTVNIGSFVYYYDGWKRYNGGVSEDLTQFLPVTGHKGYVLIAFDPTIEQIVYRPSVYVIGDGQDIYPTFESIPGPSGDEYPLGWVYLESTTTSVDWTTDSDNIGDARLFVGFPARNILDRLTQLEGLSGNDPNIALTGAALTASDGYIHTLNNLLDVNVDSATNGQSLVYDQPTNRWISGNVGAILYSVGASDISGASAVGVSASPSPGDHVHRGVQSANVPGNTPLYGPVYFVSGTGTTVTQTGASVVISASGTGSPAGVDSVNNNNNNTPAVGAVTLFTGTGMSIAQSGGSFTFSTENIAKIFNGRLTLDGSTVVPVDDVVGASVLYYLPYNGDQISLFTPTSSWSSIQFTAPSLALTGLSPNSAYDVFGFLNGTELTLETARWNVNNITRTTGLSAQNGVRVSSTNKTRVLLGSIYMGSTSDVTADSDASRFVSNYYNRIPRTVGASEPTLSWAYSINAWRALNNNTQNRVQMVFTDQVLIDVSGYGYARPNNVGIIGQIGLGQDTTTANCAIPGVIGQGSSGGGTQAQLYARLIKYAPLGFHFFQAVEKSSGTSTSYFSADPAGAYKGGVTGIIQA